jgi:hypothetical protein
VTPTLVIALRGSRYFIYAYSSEQPFLEAFWIEKDRLLEGVDAAGQVKLLFSRENV